MGPIAVVEGPVAVVKVPVAVVEVPIVDVKGQIAIVEVPIAGMVDLSRPGVVVAVMGRCRSAEDRSRHLSSPS